MNLIERVLYNGNKGIKRFMALALCAIVIITGNFGMTAFADTISKSEPDIYAQELVENIDIEGVNYIFKHYYNENGERSISITNTVDSTTQVLTYDNRTSNIYLDGEIMGDTSEFQYEDQPVTPFAIDTSWKLIGSPGHERVSWARGSIPAAVAGVIAIALGMKTTYVVTAMGIGALGILAGQSVGGTVHFSKYYRDLALGEVQYRTDWSFVASTGDRYGTYNYYSVPQPF